MTAREIIRQIATNAILHIEDLPQLDGIDKRSQTIDTIVAAVIDDVWKNGNLWIINRLNDEILNKAYLGSIDESEE